jgi:uncharacterized protein involved in exopolysaccharide biosynthesis
MPSETPDLDAERDVDLSRHWGAITRHWWLPLGGLAAGIIVGYLISLGGAQVYKAKAVVSDRRRLYLVGYARIFALAPRLGG